MNKIKIKLPRNKIRIWEFLAVNHGDKKLKVCSSWFIVLGSFFNDWMPKDNFIMSNHLQHL